MPSRICSVASGSNPSPHRRIQPISSPTDLTYLLTDLLWPPEERADVLTTDGLPSPPLCYPLQTTHLIDNDNCLAIAVGRGSRRTRARIPLPLHNPYLFRSTIPSALYLSHSTASFLFARLAAQLSMHCCQSNNASYHHTIHRVCRPHEFVRAAPTIPPKADMRFLVDPPVKKHPLKINYQDLEARVAVELPDLKLHLRFIIK